MSLLFQSRPWPLRVKDWLCALFGRWQIGRLAAPGEAPTAALPPPDRRAQRRDDGRPIAAAATHRPDPLKHRDEAVRALSDPAHQDPLTGLWNIAYLGVLGERLRQQEDLSGSEFSVLWLGLDGLQSISDRCGHDTGDQMLVQTARRLQHLARAQDVVFRLGGDEFLLLLGCPRGQGAALASAVAARVLADVTRPIGYRTLNNLRLGCSIGATVWSPQYAELGATLRHASEALAAAKRSGRGHYRHYLATADAATAAPAQVEG